MITASANNNGISAYTDIYDYDGIYVSVSSDGSYAGTCFVQNGKFSITGNVNLLRLKPEYQYLEPALISLVFTMTLHFRSQGRGFCDLVCASRLMNESIPNIPYVRDPRTNEWKIDVGALRYMYM